MKPHHVEHHIKKMFLNLLNAINILNCHAQPVGGGRGHGILCWLVVRGAQNNQVTNTLARNCTAPKLPVPGVSLQIKEINPFLRITKWSLV